MPGDVARSMATKTDALDSLRAFNRFELKYLVARDQIGDVRADLSERLQPDAHSADGAYSVWSRYYDTADLKFYWEKIDGIRFRRKLRIRHYGSPDQLTPDTPVYVEIKQRVNRVTQKRRIALPYREAVARATTTSSPLWKATRSRSATRSSRLAPASIFNLRPSSATAGWR